METVSNKLNTSGVDVVTSHRLCIRRWSRVTAYHNGFTVSYQQCVAHSNILISTPQETHSYKELYMYLDNGTLTFKADPHEVIYNKLW